MQDQSKEGKIDANSAIIQKFVKKTWPAYTAAFVKGKIDCPEGDVILEEVDSDLEKIVELKCIMDLQGFEAEIALPKLMWYFLEPLICDTKPALQVPPFLISKECLDEMEDYGDEAV